MIIAVGISFVLVMIALWWVFSIHRQAHEIDKRILNGKQHCNKCNDNFFICPICSCQFETQGDADLCADWDKILGLNRHAHSYLHDHLNDD